MTTNSDISLYGPRWTGISPNLHGTDSKDIKNLCDSVSNKPQACFHDLLAVSVCLCVCVFKSVAQGSSDPIFWVTGYQQQKDLHGSERARARLPFIYYASETVFWGHTIICDRDKRPRHCFDISFRRIA